MGRKCAVPHCYTGYRKCQDKTPMYRAPTDFILLAKWQEAIAREDRPINPNDYICAKHFRDDDMVKQRIIKDSVHVYQRRPLIPDAVPSIFPEIPDSIHAMVKKRRKMSSYISQIQQTLGYNNTAVAPDVKMSQGGYTEEQVFDEQKSLDMAKQICGEVNNLQKQVQHHHDKRNSSLSDKQHKRSFDVNLEVEKNIVNRQLLESTELEDGKMLKGHLQVGINMEIEQNMQLVKAVEVKSEKGVPQRADEDMKEHIVPVRANEACPYNTDAAITSEVIIKDEVDPWPDAESANATPEFNNLDINSNRLKIYSCDQCDYRTKYQSNLRTHKITHMTGDDVYFHCDICPDYKTKWKYVMKNHINMKHTQNKEVFVCKVCRFETSSKSYMYKHKRKHLDRGDISVAEIDSEKYFRCTECDYGADSKALMIAHVKGVHETVADAQQESLGKTKKVPAKKNDEDSSQVTELDIRSAIEANTVYIKEEPFENY